MDAKIVIRKILRWALVPKEDKEIDVETEDNNLYKRDLLRAMQTIDDFDSGHVRMNNALMVEAVKSIGLIVYSAGPAIARSSIELIEPLVAIYDTESHTKDIKVACLMVLSTIMMLNPEHQERGAESDFHMALLDDLEQYTYNIQDCIGILQTDNSNISMAKSLGGNRESFVSFIANSVRSATSNVMKEKKAKRIQLEALQEDHIFIAWIIYTLKSLTLGNPTVVNEVVKSVDNKIALRDLIKSAGDLIEWEQFLSSKENQAELLVLVLGLDGDLTPPPEKVPEEEGAEAAFEGFDMAVPEWHTAHGQDDGHQDDVWNQADTETKPTGFSVGVPTLGASSGPSFGVPTLGASSGPSFGVPTLGGSAAPGGAPALGAPGLGAPGAGRGAPGAGRGAGLGAPGLGAPGLGAPGLGALGLGAPGAPGAGRGRGGAPAPPGFKK